MKRRKVSALQKLKTSKDPLSVSYCMSLPLMKLTTKRAKYFMKDEKKASRVYKKLKLNKLSKDEKRHFKFFKTFLKHRK